MCVFPHGMYALGVVRSDEGVLNTSINTVMSNNERRSLAALLRRSSLTSVRFVSSIEETVCSIYY